MEIRTPSTDVEWDNYFDLRFRLLRKPWGQPLGSERNEGDVDGKHFALYYERVLLAIGRLDEVSEQICQLRFFAVENNVQGKGYGKILMESILLYAKNHNYNVLTLQARENAVPFYENLGFETRCKTHVLFGSIQHYEMQILIQ